MNESEERYLARTSSSDSIGPKSTLAPTSQHQDSSSIMSHTQPISELEWDKELDFVRKAESDTLSVYDLNERVQELLRQRILDFEMLSLTESVKNLSCFEEPDSELDDQKGLTSEDIFRIKFFSKESSRICSPQHQSRPCVYSPITFGSQSSISLQNNSNLDHFSNSMPDLRAKKSSQQIQMVSKHRSLLDLSNFKCIYVQRSECLGHDGPRLSYGLPRMSRLQTIKCYLNRLGEKVRTMIKEAFRNGRHSAAKANQLQIYLNNSNFATKSLS
ncbi:hypothetical protein BpHYR1_018352 [Brachionus plicatilis]|uniref:Uncharacterized protein n=1 Tax=Brachionus plicatilis TaxID=10195 RepID=A0A3M7PB31_BRAPC|nr:hypothetical protein BpHYR1_018352 [Brachionus plicatilis]